MFAVQSAGTGTVSRSRFTNSLEPVARILRLGYGPEMTSGELVTYVYKGTGRLAKAIASC